MYFSSTNDENIIYILKNDSNLSTRIPIAHIAFYVSGTHNTSRSQARSLHR